MAAAPASERTERAAWTLLLASSVLYFFSINEADNDLWGHVFFGRAILTSGSVPRVDTYAYTTLGHTWVNHEWLSQVLLATAYQWAGAPGLLLLKLAVAIATFLCVFGQIRRNATAPYVWGGVGVLSIAILARGFAIRPQIFTYCGLALTLWVLLPRGQTTDNRQQTRKQREGQAVSSRTWLLPPLFLLWANLHGGFVLGLGIVGLFAAASVVTSERRWQPWLVLMACVVATVVNPYGPRLYGFVWNELSRTHPITEWQGAHPSDVAQWVFFAMFGLFIVTVPFATRWREHGWQVVLAVAVGVLAVRHQRHTPVFALCAAAPLAAQLEGMRSWFMQRSSFALGAGARRVITLGLGALALTQIGFTLARWQRDGLQIVFDPREYPTQAVRAMQHADAHANIAVPLDWGEYVLWFLAPQVKVSLDGRFATLFPEELVADNFNFFSGAPGWRRLIEQYPTDAALVPTGSSCPITRESGWQRVYGDAVAEIYVRADRAVQLRIVMQAEPATGIFP